MPSIMIISLILLGCPRDEAQPAVEPEPAPDVTTMLWPDGCRTCTCVPDGELRHCVCDNVDEALCEGAPHLIQE